MRSKKTGLIAATAGMLLVCLALVCARTGLFQPTHEPKPTLNEKHVATEPIPDPAPAPEPGEDIVLRITRQVSMQFVWIEALGLWAGRYEVANNEYRCFKPNHNSKDRHGHTLNNDRQPAVEVNFHHAGEYAAWLTARSHTYKQLPTNYVLRLPFGKEWSSLAACGDDRSYPWGSNWPPSYGNYADQAATNVFTQWSGVDGYSDGFPVTCPVEQSGNNEWGLYGLGGNVWEWTMDPVKGKPTNYVIRGASFYESDTRSLQCLNRKLNRPPTAKGNYLGFRLVLAQRQ